MQGSVSEGTSVGRTGRAQAHTGLQVSAKANTSAEALRVQDSEKRGNTPASWPGAGGPQGPFRVSICALAQGPKRPKMIPVGDGPPRTRLPPNVQGHAGLRQGPRALSPCQKLCASDSHPWFLPREVQSLPVDPPAEPSSTLVQRHLPLDAARGSFWARCTAPRLRHLLPPKLPSLPRAVHANKTLCT